MATKNNNIIPLDTAKQWAATWQKDNTLKAFLIQKDNIDSIVAAGGNVADFRGYMGIDDSGSPTLLVVGVDADGKDIIDESSGYFVYDANRPCPSTCDASSPLFKP